MKPLTASPMSSSSNISSRILPKALIARISRTELAHKSPVPLLAVTRWEWLFRNPTRLWRGSYEFPNWLTVIRGARCQKKWKRPRMGVHQFTWALDLSLAKHTYISTHTQSLSCHNRPCLQSWAYFCGLKTWFWNYWAPYEETDLFEPVIKILFKKICWNLDFSMSG